MPVKKLLQKLQVFFDADERQKKAQKREIKKVLKKLKAKEKKIQAKLEQSHDPELCGALQKELDIIYAQRKKGIKIIKEL